MLSCSLVGAFTRRLLFITLYLGMLVVHLIFSIATGIYAINKNFKDAPKYISSCESGTTEKSVHDGCVYASNMVKAVMVSVFIIAWLIQACMLPLHLISPFPNLCSARGLCHCCSVLQAIARRRKLRGSQRYGILVNKARCSTVALNVVIRVDFRSR